MSHSNPLTFTPAEIVMLEQIEQSATRRAQLAALTNHNLGLLLRDIASWNQNTAAALDVRTEAANRLMEGIAS